MSQEKQPAYSDPPPWRTSAARWMSLSMVSFALLSVFEATILGTDIEAPLLLGAAINLGGAIGGITFALGFYLRHRPYLRSTYNSESSPAKLLLKSSFRNPDRNFCLSFLNYLDRPLLILAMSLLGPAPAILIFEVNPIATAFVMDRSKRQQNQRQQNQSSTLSQHSGVALLTLMMVGFIGLIFVSISQLSGSDSSLGTQSIVKILWGTVFALGGALAGGACIFFVDNWAGRKVRELNSSLLPSAPPPPVEKGLLTRTKPIFLTITSR